MSKQTAKKPAARKSSAKKPAAKKVAAKKAPARSAAKKSPAKKTTSAKKTSAKPVAGKSPVKKAATKPAVKKQTAKQSASVQKASAKATRKPSAKASAEKATSKPKKESSPAKAAAEAAAGETEKELVAVPDVDGAVSSTAGFTLDDVRSVLDARKKESLKNKSPAGTKSKPKAESKPKPKAAKKAPIKKKAAAATVTDILGFNPAKSSTSLDRDESKIPAKWKPYFRQLVQFRAQLKEALGERSEETIGASVRESSGELSVNSPDAGSESFDRDVALSMVAGEQETLQEVEAAIDRIFAGTYGVCQETGKPIKQTRLKAVPFTRFSLEGQAQSEQCGSKDRDKGGGVFATLSEASLGDDQA